MREFHRIAAAACLAGLAGTSAMAQEVPAMPPRPVGVVEMQQQEVPRVMTLPGRAVAAQAAGIRPRVGGIVTDILYQPGIALEAGAPMFRLDAATYEANLASAEAQVASARAQLTQAESAMRRAEQLLGSGTTQAQVETARATFEQARAGVEGAEAARRLAQSELDWTTVTSPIAGIASVPAISVGDLVTAGQAGEMARVTQLDPIEVDMYEPSSRFLSVLNDIQAGRLRMNDELRATLTLENGQVYEALGTLVAPGVTVSASTGSIDSRFRFDNPEGVILPGMFLRGQVELGTEDAILVSQSATSRDKIGTLTAWVAHDGTARQRRLTEDGTYQHQWIVTGGIEPGELLIVDGLAALTEGAPVAPVPVSYDENGVLRETAPAAEPAAGAAAEAAPEQTAEPTAEPTAETGQAE
ncbi:MAG: efflux RND transporter periplasmic adaptor subunit [Paracoccus sp. (in: a-proteobacteria)]|uniref:efflux RND transporter periplasmic adaptor subunit n=1 Tax=Paracoccus sp. TaxID=267 RepID=UPI00391C79E6